MQNNNTNEDVIEIDLQELLGLLMHRLWLLAICGIVGGVAAFLVSSFLITPLYESTTSIYILNKNDNNTFTYSDVQMNTQLTKDYAKLITSRSVLESVIESCTIEESYKALASRIDVKTLSDTRIIEITVTDEDPLKAQMLANVVRIQASEHIRNVMEIQAVNVVDEANLPESPASPSVKKWTVIGGALGIFLCALVLVVKFLLDDTIKTTDDVEKYLELSTLAMIPIAEEEDGKKHRRRMPEVHKPERQETGEEEEEIEEIDLEQPEGKTFETQNDREKA